MTITPKITTIESGFAKVVNADTGRTMGYVRRDDPWKVVSGVRWTAYRTRSCTMELGRGDTRADAVAAIVAHASRFVPKAGA